MASFSGMELDSQCSGASTSSQQSYSASSSWGYRGYLIVHGTNGRLSGGDKGRKKSVYALVQKNDSNGVKPVPRIKESDNSAASKSLCEVRQYEVTYELHDNRKVTVIHERDPTTDMFQIGRASDDSIDFVILDTVPGLQMSNARAGAHGKAAQSTISRYACRLLMKRNSNPAEISVYAAAFDGDKKIFLGEKGTNWETETGFDGLTTNGIFLLHLNGDFMGGDATPAMWREVSVGGDLYTLRSTRSAPQKGFPVKNETNQLKDGSMIDLCGATLLWRTPESLGQGPRKRWLKEQYLDLNKQEYICPVRKVKLRWTHRATLPPPEETPHIYLTCGHVVGMHEWAKVGEEKACPVCHKVGIFAQLSLGYEPAFWVDSESPSHAFNPCGHVTSEKSVKFWAKVPVPHGTNGFIATCPFCATPLVDYPGYVKLAFTPKSTSEASS